MIILSILMATTPERVNMFSALQSNVSDQIKALTHAHPSLPSVEIVVDDSPGFLNGGPSIGLKRSSLVSKSNGKYICFLDSDDGIPSNYIESLVRLCITDADVCTFRAIAKLNDYWALVDMRLCFKTNDQLTPEYTVRRPPWPVCPVKSKYAKLYEFNDKNNAEDFEWMEKVLRHCTTEAHTDRILFCYNHGDHSEADKIPLPGLPYEQTGLGYKPLTSI